MWYCKMCCFSIQPSSFLFHLWKPKPPNYLLHSSFSASPSPNLCWYHHQSRQALVLRHKLDCSLSWLDWQEVHLLHVQQWEKRQWLDHLPKRHGRRLILIHSYKTATLRLSPSSFSTQFLSLIGFLYIFRLGFPFDSWVNSSLLLMC